MFEYNTLSNIINPNGNSKDQYYILKLLSGENDCFDIKDQFKIEHYDDICLISKDKDHVAINYSKRNIKIIDLINLKIKYNIILEGAGCIGDIAFIDNKLYVTNETSKLLCLDFSLNKNLDCTIVQDLVINKNYSNQLDFVSLLLINDKLRVLNHCLKFSKSLNLILFSSENGLYCYNFRDSKFNVEKEAEFKISACGISHNHVL